jgi:hypothetical protein
MKNKLQCCSLILLQKKALSEIYEELYIVEMSRNFIDVYLYH